MKILNHSSGRWAGLIAAGLMAASAAAQPHDAITALRSLPLETSPDLPPGYVMVDGDIIMRMDQYLLLIMGGEATYALNPWPGGLVRFGFNTDPQSAGFVSPANQTRMLAAMAEISAVAGITFEPPPHPFGAPWIHIHNGTGNSSLVGMSFAGQPLNIVSWTSHYTIVHELYHALGLWHEHQAPDRDQFITIHQQNISSGNGNQFLLIPPGAASTYGPYDFDSVMHYGPCAFSIGGNSCAPGERTITTINPAFQNVIGQETHLSYWDKVIVRALYPFAADRWWTPHAGFSMGSFSAPYHGHPINAVLATPPGGTLFLKHQGAFSATGLYTATGPVTIDAPEGPVTLGN